MTTETGGGGEVREFRLEGAALAILAVLALALLFGAFQLGRWYERRRAPSAPAAASDAGPARGGGPDAAPTAVDAREGATFFDSAAGKPLEPRREAQAKERTAPAAAEEPPAESSSALPEAAGGPFYVQLTAVRDRRSAERVVSELRERGYPVVLATERDGQDTLFKVRVGGYPTREDAAPALERLQRDGYASAWITRVD